MANVARRPTKRIWYFIVLCVVELIPTVFFTIIYDGFCVGSEEVHFKAQILHPANRRNVHFSV